MNSDFLYDFSIVQYYKKHYLQSPYPPPPSSIVKSNLCLFNYLSKTYNLFNLIAELLLANSSMKFKNIILIISFYQHNTIDRLERSTAAIYVKFKFYEAFESQ